jgi:prepilin-type N-terminal cleavage/methylation domain-containing protein
MMTARSRLTARRGTMPRAFTPPASSPGFTLLEVMLAVTILGIVATAVYGTFSRTLRAKGIAEERAEVTRIGRSALGHMAEEIASAFYPTPRAPGAIFRSVANGTESAPLDALVFSALSPRPSGFYAGDSDQRVIAYFFPQRRGRMRAGTADPVAEDVDDFFAAFGPLRVPVHGIAPERLLRREAVMTAPAATVSDTATAFLDNVASLRLRFHDGTDWLDAWDSEDRVNYRPLPRAVAIDLALYDAAGEIHHFATAVDLALADSRPGPRHSPVGGQPTTRPTPARRGSVNESEAR